MDTVRKPFQGVWNIVRFNWHFYLFSICLVAALLGFAFTGTLIHTNYLVLPAITILLVTIISLLASSYVYDFSNLYSLQWMDGLSMKHPESIVNVNAGFDETSSILVQKYPEAEFTVLDFYNSKIHTEISIKRARNAYPPFPGTISIDSNQFPIKDQSVDLMFAILSAHEIRDENERILFFNELKRSLKEKGSIIVAEHLRDIPNFLAYTIGFFHFHSKKTWFKTFKSANLKVTKEIKITPLLQVFVLQHV